MNQIDETYLDELVEVLYKKIEEKFNKKLNESSVEFTSDGIVVASSEVAHGSTTQVQLAFVTTHLIPNLTGQPIKNGQKVRVFYSKNNLSDAYIGTVY